MSFRINEGELVGYIGPNGAGKSTTVKVMSGILTPDKGKSEEIIRKAGLKPGDDIICYYDDVTEQIVIARKPRDYAKELRGLGKEVWQDSDPVRYVREERDSW